MASKAKFPRKVLSLFLSFILLITQTGFAQVAAVELNLTSHFARLGSSFTQDKFRLPHLRYFSYDNTKNNIQLLLDKGDLKDLKDLKLEESGKELLKYFLIGVTLPDDNFWVNLRPNSEDNIIPDMLAKTDIGKIFLETDVQLKKDTATFTSPATPQGKLYWDKLYQKAAEIYGTQNVTIPTLTRPWIVPGEIIIREAEGSSAYVYKATLKVMLEQDHLKGSATYNFEDNRAKQLNEYSSQLIRELILPELTKKVNNAKSYASLRQVYYSLILARWFKSRFYGKGGLYASYINKSNLQGLTSNESWSKNTYFKQYQSSFKDGEYNLQSTVSTSSGPSIRSYFSGGLEFGPNMNIITQNKGSSPIIAGFTGGSSSPVFMAAATSNGLIPFSGMASIANPMAITHKAGLNPTNVSSPINIQPVDSLRVYADINQRIWLDGLTFEMLLSGEFENLVRKHGITGVTTNPSLIKAYLSDSRVIDKAKELAVKGLDKNAIYYQLVSDLAKTALGIFEKTGIYNAKFSVELNPAVNNTDVAEALKEALQWTDIDPVHMMIKVALSSDANGIDNQIGYKIIEEVISRGRNVNVTLIFTAEHYQQVVDAYIRGLQRGLVNVKEGRLNKAEFNRVYSVASFFVSRWDVYLEENKLVPENAHGQVANSITIKAYNEIFKNTFSDKNPTWNKLKTSAAALGLKVNPQDFLLASTGSKGTDLLKKGFIDESAAANYPAGIYVHPIQGSFVVNTLPYSTIKYLIENGVAKNNDGSMAKTIESGYASSREIMDLISKGNANLTQIGAILLKNATTAFSNDYNSVQNSLDSVVNGTVSSPVTLEDLKEETDSFMYKNEPVVSGQLPQEVLDLYNNSVILEILSKNPSLKGIREIILDPSVAKYVAYGTSGDRAEVYNEDPAVVSRFNVQRVLIDAQGIASYYKANNLKGAVRIGYETRLMAREYGYLTAAVLAANGIRVKLPANAVPLPSLAFSVANSQETDDPDAGGIMITASHNPWPWLGIKWLLTNGGAAPATVTEPLQKITKEGSVALVMPVSEAINKGLIKIVTYRQDYINYILNNIPSEAVTALKTWGSKISNKVISNPVQGGAIGYVPQILQNLGIKYEEKNNTIDRMFAGSDKRGPNPDYALDFDESIAQAHKKGQNIIEIMQDVDADRFGVRDVNGIRYTANELIPMYKWFLATKGYKGAIGKTIPTSDLSNAVDRYWGDETLEVDTGFKNLVDPLESGEDIVVGEESAHVGIGIWKKSKDDGIAVGLLAVWIIAETGKSLTEYKKEIESTIGTHFKYRRIDTPYKGARRQEGAQMLELINLTEAAAIVKHNNGQFNFAYKGNEDKFTNLPIINEKIIPVANLYGGLSKVLICYDPLSGKSSGYKMVFADNSVVTVRVSGTGEPVIRTYVEIVTPCTKETWDKVDAGSDARWQELANKSRDAIGIYRLENSVSSPVQIDEDQNTLDLNERIANLIQYYNTQKDLSATLAGFKELIPEMNNSQIKVVVISELDRGLLPHYFLTAMMTKTPLGMSLAEADSNLYRTYTSGVDNIREDTATMLLGKRSKAKGGLYGAENCLLLSADQKKIETAKQAGWKTVTLLKNEADVKNTVAVLDMLNGIETVSSNSKPSSPISAQEVMNKFYTITQLLGIKDSKRIAQIFLTSLDPVAFVQSLADAIGRSTEEIVAELQKNALFKPLAADYRLRTAKELDPREFENRFTDVNIGSSLVYVQGKQQDLPNQPLSEYLKARRNYAGNTAFVFRDNTREFVARFLGQTVSNPDSADLLSLIDLMDIFLNSIDIPATRYVITSGIGANEMYSHQLAKIINDYFQAQGINMRWLVMNNPADVQRIPADANNDNTVIFEMSRSGTTKETLDFFNATKDKFKKRVVAANPGKNNLNTLAIELQKEPGASILTIDDTRGDIGGRQMNRRTLMVYLPLYLALVSGLKDKTVAKEYLKEYVQALLDANEKFAYQNELKSQPIQLAEFLFRHRAAGRNKFSVVYDDSLKASAKEFFQLINEGANKNIAGGSNNNILLAYSLQQDKSLYEPIFYQSAEKQLSIFILNKNSTDYQSTLSYIQKLKYNGIPVIAITVDIGSDIKKNLRVIAQTSALLQDMVVYFTYITNQDANSNPAVKFVREITAAMFDIVKDKKARGQQDIRISFEDVVTKIKQKQDADNQNSQNTMNNKFSQMDKTTQELPASFVNLADSLVSLAQQLGLKDEKAVAGAFIAALSKNVVMTDVGEAGANKVSDINAAFGLSEIATLGKNSIAPVIPALNMQTVLSAGGLDGKVSVAVNQDNQFVPRTADLSKQMAEYFTQMYALRKDKLQQIALTYMEVDQNNPIIKEIAKSITGRFADMNITVPLLALPGVAHTGIEAIMSHPENAFNIAVVYTGTYSGELGEKQVDKNITLNDATYVYGISNVIRMALGGTPSIIFEVNNSQQLKQVQEIVDKAMQSFRANIASSPVEEIKYDYKQIASYIIDEMEKEQIPAKAINTLINSEKIVEAAVETHFVKKTYVSRTIKDGLTLAIAKYFVKGIPNIRVTFSWDQNYTNPSNFVNIDIQLDNFIVSSLASSSPVKETDEKIKLSDNDLLKLGWLLYPYLNENNKENIKKSSKEDVKKYFEKIPLNRRLPIALYLIDFLVSPTIFHSKDDLDVACTLLYELRESLLEAPDQSDLVNKLLSLYSELLNKSFRGGDYKYTIRDAIGPYLVPTLNYLAANLAKNKKVVKLNSKNVGLLMEWKEMLDDQNPIIGGNDTSVYRKTAEDLLSINTTKIRVKTSSPIESENKGKGGIDFRALPITIQPLGSFKGLTFSLPSAATLAQINISKELVEISQMVDNGIAPSGQRVKELVAACYHKQELASRQEDLLNCLMRICKLEEDMVIPADTNLKEAIVIVDSVL